MEIKNVRKLLEILGDLEKEFGYKNLELAFLIVAMTDNCDLTDIQIRECYNAEKGLDEILDEGLATDLHNILFGE